MLAAKIKPSIGIILLLLLTFPTLFAQETQRWVTKNKDGKLEYYKDSLGNSIPDFSAVGYHNGATVFPVGKIVAHFSPSGNDDTYALQQLIDSVAALDETKEPKVIVLAKGNYSVSKTITINSSNIIIRGSGEDEQGTVITYTAKKQSDLFEIAGKGKLEEVGSKSVFVTDGYVPVGSNQLHLKSTKHLSINEPVLVNWIPSEAWIHAIGMDNIADLRDGSKNWSAQGYKLNYERVITAIDDKNKLITLNAPMVMAMDKKYGEGYIIPYLFNNRIREVGMENMRLVSTYSSPTDEEHGWCAIKISVAENCWVQHVTSLHFGTSCVHISSTSKNNTVSQCTCLDPISQITGGRRYSFNCDGQLTLFTHCFAQNGRHDFVTGGRVSGPNVYTHCKATLTHADIGPHHRWATGTLYDNIESDGAINAQDRGNWGSGHGWSGAYQVFWNCTAATAAIQNPPMAYNWNIGYHGKQGGDKLSRPLGVWEMTNSAVNINPTSLYEAQVKDAMGKR